MAECRFLYGFFFSLIVFFAFGLYDSGAQQLPLQSYNQISGFPNHAVTAISQDDKGYLWVGTQAGLSRFDGFSFITYNTSNGLAGNIVCGIQDDGKGGFWLCTDQGLSHYDGSTIQAFRYEDRVSENTLWDIHADENGSVWMATNGAGIVRRYTDGTFSKYQAEGDDDTNTFYTVKMLSDGTLLAGGRKGLFMLEGDSLVQAYHGELPEDIGNVILEDDDGRVWVGFQRRSIYRIENGRVEELEHIPFESARSMMQDNRGTVWIGGDGDGLLAVHSNDEFEIFTTENGLLANEIGAMHQDYDGSIWVGQLYHGLERITNRGILHYEFGGGDASFVNSIYQSANDDIWISTMDGVNRLSDEGWTKYAEGIRTWQTAEISDGTLWHSSIDYQMIANRNGNIEFYGDRMPMDELVMLSVFALDDGRLIAGSYWNGLFEYRNDSFVEHIAFESTPPSAIAGLIETDEGLWLHSHFDGLFLYQNGEIIDKDLLEQTGSHQMNHLSYDGEKIWVTTEKSFYYLDGSKWIDASEEWGIPQDNYSFLVWDDRRNPWLGSSDSGLVHHDGEQVWFLNTADGLLGGSMNHASVLIDNQNRLWAGTNNGVNKIDLNRVDLRNHAPFIEFQRMQLFDDDVEIAPNLRFRYNENYLKFDFSGIYLRDPAGVSYRYKMDQIDIDWQTSDIGSVQYTSIPSGKYRFEVEAVYGNHLRSEQAAIIEFEILPPFWQTWWFILICVVGVSLILYGIHSYRVAQILRIEKMRMQIAGDLHDEVGSNLSSISLLAEMLNRSGVINPNEKKRIERMRTASLQTLESMSDIVWAINPDNDSMDDLVMKMKEVANVLLDGIEHSFVIDESIEKDKVDLLFKRDFFLVFKEALNNIQKHAGATHVEISIQKKDPYICMIIVDNGRGFEKDKHYNGLGLKTMQKRAEKLKGNLTVESEPGKGTKTILKAKLT